MSAAIKNSGESGDMLVKATTRGPQADKAQYDRILGYLKGAEADGLDVVVGGKAETKKGFYIEPTLITNAPENHSVVREEIFGPVVVINTFEDEEEVMKRANGMRPTLVTPVVDLRRAANCTQTPSLACTLRSLPKISVGHYVSPRSSKPECVASIALPHHSR